MVFSLKLLYMFFQINRSVVDFVCDWCIQTLCNSICYPSVPLRTANRPFRKKQVFNVVKFLGCLELFKLSVRVFCEIVSMTINFNFDVPEISDKCRLMRPSEMKAIFLLLDNFLFLSSCKFKSIWSWNVSLIFLLSSCFLRRNKFMLLLPCKFKWLSINSIGKATDVKSFHYYNNPNQFFNVVPILHFWIVIKTCDLRKDIWVLNFSNSRD